tara:strand:+ start:4692 stop:5612 length:921 start_codon:yes stop_codon:yes gene_type:complete
MINYNFIFPGQGSQSVGMSRDILISNRSKTLFNEASELIGYDLLDICLNGPEDLLIKTKNTQPSVFTLSILIDQILKESNIFPRAVAGHSLGEYAALVSSNVLKFRDALKLIILRCNEMEKANNSNDGIMAAVLNASKNDISQIISLAKGILVVANYNTNSQVVISGERSEINSAIDNFKSLSKKIKCIKLKVSGAYHSPLMEFARDALSNAINSLNFNNAEIPIYQNIDAKPYQNAKKIKENLILQLESPVKWNETILNMETKTKNFIESGPGKVLIGMNKRISPEICSYEANSISKIDSICTIA